MMRWLETRPRRERRLMALAALLLIATALWLAVFRPLASYRAEALRAWSGASERLAEVEALAAEIVALRRRETAAGVRESERSVRSIVSDTARRSGLTLSRLAPESNARLGVWFEAAEATALFRWIETLRDDFGIKVTRASITANADSPSLRAQLTLAREEAAS